jgi:hypothetical protein
MANRPRIDPKRQAAASVTLQVRVTPGEAEKLRKVAAKQERNVSDLLRDAIQQAGVK